MVAVSRVFLCCVAVRAFGQPTWQAGEPMVVNVDYDVPSVGGDGATFQPHQRGNPGAAPATGVRKLATSGFSAASLSSVRRLRGEAVPPGDADVVVHVPDGGLGSADEAALLAEAHRQFDVLKRLAGKQRSQEDRVLSAIGASGSRAVSLSQQSGLRRGDAEAVAEAEAMSARGGAVASFGALAAEVAAGGHVARRALEQLVAFASDAGARKDIVASGAPAAAAALLKRRGTVEADRALAGSLLTLLSDMPVAAEVSSELTGGDGQVEIVLPRPSRVYRPDAMAMRASVAVAPVRSQL